MGDNGYAAERVGLGGGPRFCIVDVVVKVSNGEKFEPSCWIGLDPMDKLKRSSEFSAKTAWDLIYHVGGMVNGIEPKLSANLFFSDIGPSHGDDGTPGTFSQPIG